MGHSRKYGIRSTDLERILGILYSFPHVEEVVLFGSRAKGNYDKGSDIDLALLGEKVKPKDLLHAHGKLEELYLPYHIDLVIYKNIQEPGLIEHINKKGISLKARTPRSSSAS